MTKTMVLMLVIILVSAGLGLVYGLTSPKQAQAHSGYYQVQAGNGLNLRTGPGGSYQLILTMPHGSWTKAMGHVGNWMKVRYLATGQEGWAFLSYLAGPYASPGSGPAAPPPPPASGGGAICLVNYWGTYVCSSTNVGNAIRYWAAQYGLGWWGLAATAACESNFLPGAYNPASGVSGLFQFQPSTFYWQGGVSLWDVWDQSRIAAKMFRNGLAYHFHCAQLLRIA